MEFGSKTEWSDVFSEEDETSFSNTNFILKDYILVSDHSIKCEEDSTQPSQNDESIKQIETEQRTLRKVSRIKSPSQSEYLSFRKNSLLENKYGDQETQHSTKLQTVEKKIRKQYYLQRFQEQRNEFQRKKDNTMLSIFSSPFHTIKNQLKILKDISLEDFSEVIDCIQKKNYIISAYLKSGGEADVLKGYYLNEQNEEQECVFRLIFRNVEDLNQQEEEFKIMELFKNSNHTINIIERIVLEEINIIIEVIKKCKNSLQDEIKKVHKSFSYRQICYIISNLIDSIVELRFYEILHLDIKPGNILRDQQNVYVISDFGMSVKFNKKDMGARGFTKYYCPKEQIEGKQVTYLSDIYSLGKTIDQLIDFCIKQNYGNPKHQLTEKQIKILEEIKELIRKKMTNDQYQDREDCIELIFQYYEIIGKNNIVMQRYFKQKIRMIPYILEFQNKDIKFMKLLELKYSILYLQILIDSYYLPINVNDIPSEQCKIDIQQIKESGINILKFIKCIAMIGRLYFATGQASKTKSILFHCQNILKTIDLQNTFQSSLVLFQLGCLSIEGREEQSAINLFNQCLEIINYNFEGDHSFKALIMMKLGLCYFIISKCEESIQFYLRCLSMYERLHQDKPNQFHVELVKASIAQCYSRLGDYKKAILYCRNENEMRNKVDKFEISYHLLPSNLSCLAYYYEIIPNYRMAFKYQKESIEIRERNNNENYLSHAEAKIGMGNIMRQLNMTKGAHEQYLGAIEIYKKNYQKNYHQILASVYLYLGINFSNRGQFQISLYCQIYCLWVKLNSYSDLFHAYIATSLSTIGNLFQIYGYLEEGLQFAKMAYFINFKNKNTNNLMGLTNFRIGNSFLLHGNLNLALNYCRKSLKQYQQRYQNCEDQMDIARCLLKVGLSYLRLRYLKKGLEFCKKSLKMYKLLYQYNIIHPFVADAMDGVGECQLALKCFNQSYIYFKLSLKLRQLIYPMNHPEIATSYYFLGQYYERIFNFKRSLYYYEQALEIRRKFDQPNNQLLEQTKLKIIELNNNKKDLQFNNKNKL